MNELRRFHLVLTAALVISPLLARAQDDTPPPSLGDVARKARLQKQQKDSQQKDSSQDVQAAKDASSGTASVPNASAKDPSSKNAKTTDASTPAAGKDVHLVKAAKKVVTNDEIPEHVGLTRTNPSTPKPTTAEEPDDGEDGPGEKPPADFWRARILSQKNEIAALKSDIQTLSESIQYAGANCVSNCVEWNERQRQKQEQVDAMKTQLGEKEQQLDDMQEMARKQGYGSSVYDP